jgi:hypothetical protein
MLVPHAATTVSTPWHRFPLTRSLSPPPHTHLAQYRRSIPFYSSLYVFKISPEDVAVIRYARPEDPPLSVSTFVGV